MVSENVDHLPKSFQVLAKFWREWEREVGKADLSDPSNRKQKAKAPR